MEGSVCRKPKQVVIFGSLQELEITSQTKWSWQIHTNALDERAKSPWALKMKSKPKNLRFSRVQGTCVKLQNLQCSFASHPKMLVIFQAMGVISPPNPPPKPPNQWKRPKFSDEKYQASGPPMAKGLLSKVNQLGVQAIPPGIPTPALPSCRTGQPDLVWLDACSHEYVGRFHQEHVSLLGHEKRMT